MDTISEQSSALTGPSLLLEAARGVQGRVKSHQRGSPCF